MGKGAAENAGTAVVRVLEEAVTAEEIFEEVRGSDRVQQCALYDPHVPPLRTGGLPTPLNRQS